MITLRKAADRGHARHGWLDSRHTFSFAEYFDPEQMGWSALRVINQDIIQPGQGFGTHGHRDMEIFSYVLEGSLEHRDSMGSGSVIKPGDVQLMSAGTGVQHSEFNPSRTEPVHFLQIWIQPAAAGTEPSYQERYFGPESKRGRLRLLASPDGRDGSLTIGQDALILAALLDGAEQVQYRLAPGRHAYAHLARGSLTLNGQAMQAGDGAKIVDEPLLELSQGQAADILLFDLP